MITNAPDEVILQTQVIIHPETNTQLEGLYKAGDLFVTQNEPEGFHKLPSIQTVQTYFQSLRLV